MGQSKSKSKSTLKKSTRKYCDTSQTCCWNSSNNFLFLFLVTGSVVQFVLLGLSGAVAMETEIDTETKTNIETGNPFSLGLDSRPRVQLLISDDPFGSSYAVCNTPSLTLRKRYPAFVILCTASYPIEWKGSSLTDTFVHWWNGINSYRSESKIPKLLQKKTTTNNTNEIKYGQQKEMEEEQKGIFNPNGFFYHLEIDLGPSAYRRFGYMGSCQRIQREVKNSRANGTVTKNKRREIENSLLEQKVDLFMPEKDAKTRYFICGGCRFKIMNRRRITTNTGTGFLIPCPVISATMATEMKTGGQLAGANMTLIQIFNEGQEDQSVKQVEGEYDPEAGFYLWGWEKLEGIFQCVAQSPSSTSTSTTRRTTSEAEAESEEFRVEFPNESEFVRFEFVQSQWKYRKQEQEDWLDEIVLSESSVGGSRNLDLDLDFPHKENNDTTARISIDMEHVAAWCRSDYEDGRASSSPEFGLFECDTHVECDWRQICFAKPCRSRYSSVRRATCEPECKNLNVPGVDGVFKCTFGGNQVYPYFFRGLDHIQYFINTKNADKAAPNSALIQLRLVAKLNGQNEDKENQEGPILLPISPVSIPLKLYTNESHSFVCTALDFLLTKDLVFLADYENGTRAYFPPGSLHVKYLDDWATDIRLQVLVNVTTDMIRVVCLAPWFNSTEWAEAALSVTVKDVSLPQIKTETLGKGEEERVFYTGDKDRSLICSATGEPKPTFKWTKVGISSRGNGTEIEGNSHFDLDSAFSIKLTEDGESLAFPTIDQNHGGIYVCQATNERGTARQEFLVKIKEQSQTAFGLDVGATIGIVGGILVLVTAFIFTLYNYLQTRRQLRNLTADEIDEFKRGNPEALKNAEVEGENAHLLPFDKQYEIPHSEFSIDEDKILGSGEFGVVYGGKLLGADVAIKTTKSTVDVDLFLAFLKEIKVMTFIGQHSNVVQLLGTSTSRIRERVVFVLVELGVHGDLNSFLMKHQWS